MEMTQLLPQDRGEGQAFDTGNQSSSRDDSGADAGASPNNNECGPDLPGTAYRGQSSSATENGMGPVARGIPHPMPSNGEGRGQMVTSRTVYDDLSLT